MILGLSYMAMIFTVAPALRPMPLSGTLPSSNFSHGQARILREHTLADTLRSPKWYILWLMLALNVMAGAAVISVAVPLAQSLTEVTTDRASLAVIVMGVGNVAGRLFWGWMSDRIGRPLTFICLFALQFFAFHSLATCTDFATFLQLSALVASCFGAGFAVMPVLVIEYFGKRHSATIFGCMFTAWSAGAIAGSATITFVDYRESLWTISSIMLGSIILPTYLLALQRISNAPLRRIEAKQ